MHHKELGLTIHLFVRENKLFNKKAAPFTYYRKWITRAMQLHLLWKACV
ncbi:hypothetical protein [Marinobacter sp. ANT_B65]